MRHLHIDIETYSEASIADRGVYRYAMDPSFRILLVGYAWDDGPTQILDLSDGSGLPVWLTAALLDKTVVKHAHNATFERVCFSEVLRRELILKSGEWLDPAQWRCSMVLAARCGLPLSLKQVGEALRLDKQKMEEGKNLIRVFCVPNRKGGRNLPEERPEDWETFKRYCVRDVDVEREIEKALSWYEVGEYEQMLYAVDQLINDHGALVDVDMARAAKRMDKEYKERLEEEARKITGLENPNSPAQLREWLSEQIGEPVVSLAKGVMPDLCEKAAGNALASRALRIRAEMGKTSNAKYSAMLEVAGEDGRARGLTQFYGTRTGRWAGRLIQMQNLPQNHLEGLDLARRLVKAGDRESVELALGNVPDTLSQLIRTAFVAPEGKTLAVCDFSAIEARVLAWIAGEEWVLDTFRDGGDIYCATASRMFHVPVEKHGRNAHLRQKGKVAVLALGYGGGVGALDKMGGARLGLTVEEEADTVRMWREANPSIVAMWKDLEKCFRHCAHFRKPFTLRRRYVSLEFNYEDNGTLTVKLPSGRKLCYPEIQISYAEGYDSGIRYMGLNQVTRKWEWVETYGGKIIENITQAIARDCLAHTMLNCMAAGYQVVFHIHDELVMEIFNDESHRILHDGLTEQDTLDDIQEIFAHGPDWSAGLPLKGAGYITPYYLKD